MEWGNQAEQLCLCQDIGVKKAMIHVQPTYSDEIIFCPTSVLGRNYFLMVVNHR